MIHPIQIFFLFLVLSKSLLSVPKLESELKYLFLFIGDGMGNSQLHLSRFAYPENEIVFLQFPVIAMVSTESTTVITDSAAAATSIATGEKTYNGSICISADKKRKLVPISKILAKKGYRIGIVSSVSLDHATPAVFYANAYSRNQYKQIGEALFSSDFHFFGGGGLKKFGPKEMKKSLLKNNFFVSHDPNEIGSLDLDKKVYLTPREYSSGSSLSSEINRATDQLSLAKVVGAAIDHLSKRESPFFLMAESGKIDWGGHSNDAAMVASEIQAFNHAISEAMDFYNRHPNETLILVTADHATGGLGLGNDRLKKASHYELLKNQKIGEWEFDLKMQIWWKEKRSFTSLLEEIERFFGLSPKASELPLILSEKDLQDLEKAYQESFLSEDGKYKKFLSNKVTELMSEKTGVGWTTTDHTAEPVNLFALGKGSQNFQGFYSSNEIFFKILELIEP